MSGISEKLVQSNIAPMPFAYQPKNLAGVRSAESRRKPFGGSPVLGFENFRREMTKNRHDQRQT